MNSPTKISKYSIYQVPRRSTHTVLLYPTGLGGDEMKPYLSWRSSSWGSQAFLTSLCDAVVDLIRFHILGLVES